MGQDVYLAKVLEVVPHLVSHLDRNPGSPTLGSFDREHWAWAAKDFSNADLQRAVYPLALLYLNELPGNIYCGNPRVLAWIEQGIGYWTRLQHSSGSFDQWFPYESSVGTTGFTLGPMAEVYRLLKDRFREPIKNRIERALLSAARYLLSHTETHGLISNHQAGIAAALYEMYLVTKDEKIRKRFDDIIDRIAERQSGEGWLPEYGGADPGYQTLAIEYLAGIFTKSKSDRIGHILDGCLKYIVHFVHPDGTIGGAYGSRNTELYYPYGFEALAGRFEDAAYVAGFMRGAIERGAVPTPASVDIFNLVPLLTSYVRAALLPADGTRRSFENRLKGESCHFKDAGCFVFDNGRYRAIVGTREGGAIKVFDRGSGRNVFEMAGYVMIGSSGKSRFTSFGPEREPRVRITGDSISFCARFKKISRHSMKPRHFLLLRLFMLTLGRISFLREAVKRMLAGTLVAGAVVVPITLARTVRFLANQVEITDRIESSTGKLLGDIQPVARMKTRFMGSSMYYTTPELDIADPDLRDAEVGIADRGRVMTVRRIIRL